MIKTQYPFVDENGTVHNNLIKTWTDDETKTLLQVETGQTYDEAVDVYPCRYTYQEVDKPVEEEPEGENPGETPEENPEEGEENNE